MSTLLQNARMPGGEEPIDLLLENGVIAETGPFEARPFDTRHSSGIEVWDLDGRFVIPGMWDNHVHFSQWAMASRRLDVSSATSAAHAAGIVREHLDLQHPDDGTLVGFGFRDGLWPDAPTRELLDAASGNISVILISGDLHCCWLNSVALAAHGFATHPTGLLREEGCFDVTRDLDTIADDVLDSWTEQAAKQAAMRGVVGVVDLEMDWSRDVWVRRIGRGSTSLRVEFGIYTRHLERAIAEGLRTGDVIDGSNGLLTVGPYKVITDGSLNTRTAYCFDAYPGMEGCENSHGIHTVPPSELVPLMRRASKNGLTPAVHAIGDLANKLALDAFETISCTGSIEHAQLLCDNDIPRFARLGVVASVQPEHAMDDREVTDRFWAGRTRRAFPIADLAAAGARLAFGSDAPVAPLDPWISMAAAIARTRDEREPWHPEQAVSPAVALAASTRNTIARGQVADIAVIDLDPLLASPEELRRMPVAATLLGGRFTWNAL